MKVLRGYQSLPPCVVTIGAFDGVHLGHQFVIRQLQALAKNYGLPSVVVVFEPQPKEYFAQKQGRVLTRITHFRDKVRALEQLGVDYVVCLRFTPQRAQQTAEAFVEQFLVNTLHVRHVLVGDDFRFGAQRQGDFEFLQTKGLLYGFDVSASETLQNSQGTRISSSVLREALENGNFAEARALMGRPFTVEGRVAHGDKIGRTLGFPTLNIRLRRPFVLRGVFAVKVKLQGGLLVPGAASVGYRPAVNGTKQLLEVHLFDFDGHLYGQHVTIEFVQFIRPEADFPSLEALTAQIKEDCSVIKTVLSESDH